MTPARPLSRRLGVLAAIGLGLLSGCAHRGLGFPGPTRTMGHTPVAYADSIEEVELTELEDEDSVAVVPRRQQRRASRGGEEVAKAAAELVGCRRLKVDGDSYRWDCSGMVMAAHAGADLGLSGNTKAMWEQARDAGVLHKRKVPSPGDLAFFDNTYDRNKNGRRDDDLTHIGVVEEVDAEGTITVIHLGSKGVVRLVMNLRSPGERTNERGEVINSYLRASSGKDGGPVLSGELWTGFGSLWKVQELGVAEAGDLDEG